MRELLERIVENGFVRTDLVGEAGEFAFRGGILDLFPPNTAKPVRVELFGDTVDSLRWFDIETQRSEDAAGSVSVLPMTHFAATKELRSALARRLSLDFMDPLFKYDVADKIDRLNEHGTFPGIEHYLPIAGNAVSFADYLADWQVVLIEPDQTTTNIAKFESLLRSEYDAAAEKGRAVYPPETVTTPATEVLDFLGRARLTFSEVHMATRVLPSREDGEGSPAHTQGGSLAPLGMTLHAPSTDRYTNRLPEFVEDVTRSERRRIFFAAT